MTLRPDRIKLAPDLQISRLLCGLWQIVDMEKESGAFFHPDVTWCVKSRPSWKWSSEPSTWRTTTVVLENHRCRSPMNAIAAAQ